MNSDDDADWEPPSQAATDAAMNAHPPLPPLHAAGAPATAAGAAALPPLSEVLHDTENIRVWNNASGTKRAECNWCHKDFPCNATKLLFHLCGVRGKGIAICSGAIPTIHRQRYRDLLHKKESSKGKRTVSCFLLILFIIY